VSQFYIIYPVHYDEVKNSFCTVVLDYILRVHSSTWLLHVSALLSVRLQGADTEISLQLTQIQGYSK